MDNKELRSYVVNTFLSKETEFNQLKSQLEYFIVSILLNCKDILNELDSAKKVFNIIIDELDDRINTGLLDPIDGPIIKGVFAKYIDTPKLEEIFLKYRNKAIEILEKKQV